MTHRTATTIRWHRILLPFARHCLKNTLANSPTCVHPSPLPPLITPQKTNKPPTRHVQDKVPPFDSNTALAILQANLGAPADMVFAEFDPTPIAAASLGQVHLATLQTGEKVVVKVQRPGLRELFDIDTKNIRCALGGGGA